jgi:hypothetical protein
MYFFSASVMAGGRGGRRAPHPPRRATRARRSAAPDDENELGERRSQRNESGARSGPPVRSSDLKALDRKQSQSLEKGDEGRMSPSEALYTRGHINARDCSADPPSRATMQYFTPQEMAGGVRYGGKCKVGNWNENATLDEVRLMSIINGTSEKSPEKNARRPFAHSRPLTFRFFPRVASPQIRVQEYIAKKQAGTLKTDQHNRRMARALAPVRPERPIRHISFVFQEARTKDSAPRVRLQDGQSRRMEPRPDGRRDSKESDRIAKKPNPSRRSPKPSFLSSFSLARTSNLCSKKNFSGTCETLTFFQRLFNLFPRRRR